MAEQGKYPYDIQFQVRIVALLIQDPSFLRSYRDIIKPGYFESSGLSTITRVLLKYYDEHYEAPDQVTLRNALEDYLVKIRMPATEQSTILLQTVDLCSLDIPDPKYLKETVRKFGQTQSVKEGLLKSVDILKKDGDADEIYKIMQDAVLSGTDTSDLGTNVYTALERVRQIADRGQSREHRIRSYMPTLDRLTYGGPTRGQLWTIIGPPGGGKSVWLTNMGAVSVKSGYEVVHITLGDLDEDEVFFRYCARLSGVPIDQIVSGSDEFTEYVARSRGFRLQVKYYSSKAASLETIRAYLMKLRAVEGIRPSLVIIDYADEILHKEENDYAGGGAVYSGLKQIADDFKCLVWTASQPQRFTTVNRNQVITQDMIGDSWRKTHKADGVITYNQCPEEYEEGTARIWVDKVRKGKRYKLFTIRTDFPRMHFREVLQQEAA